MYNIIDYINENGEKSFEDMPFNPVDSLCLSQLSYLKYDGMIPGPDEGAPSVTFPGLAMREDVDRLFTDKRYEKNNRALFNAAAGSRRFGTIGLNCFVNMIDEDWELQFSAMTCICGGFSYIVFRGTDDNVVGWKEDLILSYRSDTPGQLRAVDYLTRIAALTDCPLRACGHSKGGNKAMYVTIICDNVDRCICYDGQGFSQEFMDKYSVEIQQNSSKITCYALETDFVHLLLFPVPGTNTIYMAEGDLIEGKGGKGHYPEGPFNIIEADGKWYIRQEGGMIREVSKPNKVVEILHDLTNFMVNNMSPDERRQMAEFLGPLVASLRCPDDYPLDLVIYIQENREVAVKLVAYILKYMKDNDLDFDMILDLVEMIGILKEDFLKLLSKVSHVPEGLIKTLVNFLLDNITDGKDDPFIHFMIDRLFGDNAELIHDIWHEIEDAYTSIHVTAGTGNYVSKIRDYSRQNYELIMETIRAVSGISLPGANGWSAFSTESWYAKMQIAHSIRCINGYNKAIEDICDECCVRANNTFDAMKNVDKVYGERIRQTASSAQELVGRILG